MTLTRHPAATVALDSLLTNIAAMVLFGLMVAYYVRDRGV